jgi:type IV pili sensor histidine kinase/response regulator
MQNKLLMLTLSVLLLGGCANRHSADRFDQATNDNALRQSPSVLSSPSNPLEQGVHIARYSVVSPTPTIAQQDVLKVMVTVNMPGPIVTVGDAIHHLLKPSGYALARFDAQGPEVIQLLNLPLPAVHRKLGPMPLQEALLTLASPAFRLYTDPVHRLIAYDLKPDYQLELAP